MRYSRIVTAFILSASLVLILALGVNGSAEITPLVVDCASLYYRPSGSQGDAIYSVIYPTVTSTGYYDFSITEHIDDNGNMVDLRSIGIVMYPDTESLTPEFQYGYIYTYNFEFRMPTSRLDVEPSDVQLSFGVCTAEMGEAISLTDVTYTYSSSQAFYIYNATAVLYVDENFSLGNLSDTEDLYLYLDVTGAWTGNFSMRCLEQKVTKAVGENAYYQASLDAIQNLPESEYGFIYNSMPDAEGEIDVVQGEILDILSAYDSDIQQLVQAMSIEQARPVVYLPEVHIPFLDVHVWDNHFFYVDDYLNQMSPKIMNSINVLVTFVRLVLFVLLTTVTMYKMSRIEWWY